MTKQLDNEQIRYTNQPFAKQEPGTRYHPHSGILERPGKGGAITSIQLAQKPTDRVDKINLGRGTSTAMARAARLRSS